MSDQKLLELAAKAAGIKGTYFVYTNGPNGVDVCGIEPEEVGKLWNPLEDDSEALRLACDLSLDLEINQITVIAYYARYQYVEEKCNGKEDRAKALRRAIVRAAAEIGRRL